MFKLHPTVRVLVFCAPSLVYFHPQSSSLAIRWAPICYLLFVMSSSWCIATLLRPRLHCTGEIWKRKFHSENTSNVFNPTITSHFKQGNHVITVKPSFFEQLHFQNVFRLRENEKPAFSNFCGSKSVLENIRFRDRSVWTDRPNRRNKATFSNC